MPDGDDSKTKGEPAHQTDPQAAGEAGLRAGDRIGRYVLISSIGQGGMGVVFLAYDPELDRKVALKLLKLGKLGTTGKQRLLREAQALARLSNPNVVPVYDVGTVDEQAFVAMEYVEGQTLKRWLKTPRAWRDVVAVMRDAGRGLAAAHAAGLVHRDFKPDNVLIGADGRVRVVDFGLAREVDDLSNPSGVTPADRPDGRPIRETRVPKRSSSGSSRDEHHSLSQVTRADQIIGTPAYMAPEQVANGACDDRADQFSFGVTFYEALYRQRPYDVTDTIDGDALLTIADKRKHPARSVAVEPPRHTDVPSWVQRIVMRALSHDPIHRFPSMDALLAALDKDPAVTRRRVATVAAMVVVLGLGAVGFVRGQAAKRRLCEGAPDEVQKAWSPEARERVRLAFAKTNLSYAELASSTLARLLDQYAVDWSNQY
ncbi:MAG TPA: protein kinase, partial [Polyangia bacterium]